MTIPSGNGDFTIGYEIATDHNSGSQVWSNSAGAYVNNSDATYQTWLASPAPVYLAAISNVADNGSGFVRLTVAQTNFGDLTTNQVLFIGDVTGTPGANGVQTITVVNPTTIDLLSVSFVASGQAADAGIFGPPAFTQASIFAQINAYNQSLLQTLYGQNLVSTSGDITFTNPVKLFQNISISAAGHSVTMPQANVPTAVPIGVPILFANTGGQSFTLRDSGGGNQGTVTPGQFAQLVLRDNSTSVGLYETVFLIQLPIPRTSGNIIVDQGVASGYQSETVSGDATLSSSGALTLASTITAGGPTGDASHVAQITYDAKGRLTAVSSVAISGTPPGGSAGGYLSGTYPNPNVAKVLGTATNDNAAAGDVGEAPNSQSSSTGLTANTGTMLTSISLTAGDWDVWGHIQFSSTNAGVTTVALLAGSISSSSGAIDTGNVDRYDEVSGNNNLLFTFANLPSVKPGASRVSLATPTTYYINAYAGFTGIAADVHAVGKIQARRRR